MTKAAKADAATPETEVTAASEPTVADLMAQVAALTALVQAQKAPEEAPVSFDAEVADAEKRGFKAQVVASLQKGASPALRVDY